jgi:hypothetical protein
VRTPAAIFTAFYINQCGSFFDFHEHELKSIISQDHRICCVDERGITAVQHSKFVSTRGKQEVVLLTSAERGNLNILYHLYEYH